MKVLGKLSVPGLPTNLDDSRARAKPTNQPLSCGACRYHAFRLPLYLSISIIVDYIFMTISDHANILQTLDIKIRLLCLYVFILNVFIAAVALPPD